MKFFKSIHFLIPFCFFVLTLVLGVWMIFQSRSSTAAIGILFLPFYGMFTALLALGFTKLSSKAAAVPRTLGYLCLIGAMGILILFIKQGVGEIQKNRERDLIYQQNLKKIETYRKEIQSLLKAQSPDPHQALDQQIQAHLQDRNFLIPALETEFVLPERLEQLSQSDDLGIVLSVARNKNTSPSVLEKIYRHSTYPDYFFQALAANSQTPEPILRELFQRPRSITGLDYSFAKNPSMPKDILEILATSDNPHTLQMLIENTALNCQLVTKIKQTLSQQPSTRPQMAADLSALKAKLCP